MLNKNKYLLFGFLPIYKLVKSDNQVKRYILGIPFSSYQNKGDYTVKRTFFQMLKKKKSYMYSKYYFLGIQIWCKKKSKVNVLMDKVEKLQFENNSLKTLLIQQTGPSIKNCNKEENVLIMSPRTIDNVKIRPNEIMFVAGDNSKLKTELNWKPQYTLKDTIKDMISYEQQNKG